jgi:hypothetical protein
MLPANKRGDSGGGMPPQRLFKDPPPLFGKSLSQEKLRLAPTLGVIQVEQIPQDLPFRHPGFLGTRQYAHGHPRSAIRQRQSKANNKPYTCMVIKLKEKGALQRPFF